ncbi:MAG: hypothetical protein E7521_02455 [Ruminococcaceae bacterium]|nr:hypothetical protein [Oscillospiraceae bacterium]
MMNCQKRKFFIVTTMIIAICFVSFFVGCSKNIGNDSIKASIGNAEQINDLLKLKHRLRVNENGEFTILFFSDVQFSTPNIAAKTLDDIETIVSRETPDLVVFNGDNSTGIKDIESMRIYISNMTRCLEKNKIPWAHVYGNHDAEGDNLPKEIQQEIYESFDYCVSKAGDENLFGVGNFVIPVLDYSCDKIEFNVWCLDSGSSRIPYNKYKSEHKEVDGNVFYAHYEPMQQNQVDWFKNTTSILEKYNGGHIPGIMAFHIPLQETYYAWNNKEKLGLEWSGEKRENISAHAQDVSLFAAAKESDILAIINSHDHLNDFMVRYEGIRLCYTASIGINEYYADDMLGGRIVKFSAQNPTDIKTYMSYVNRR